MTKATFTEGSLLNHILKMTASSTIGLLAIFLVDFVDLYFLGLLGEVAIAAAIGFAGSIIFFSTSLCIGLAIACGALVSRAVGQEKLDIAKRYTTNSFVTSLLIVTPVTIALWTYSPELLKLLGASGRALELAIVYLRIVILSVPLLVLGISSGAVLRSLGDAKNSMYLTVCAGIANAILDPIFIFTLEGGVAGAAWASFCSRIVMILMAYYNIVWKRNFIGKFQFSCWKEDIRSILKISVPAMFTNLSTPIGIAYVTAVMANYGDGAVAANAIIGRLQPLVFAGIFALSGAVGPIVGQNLGAKKMDRISGTLFESLKFIFVYCLIGAAFLYLTKGLLVDAFKLEGEAASLLELFCNGINLLFIFHGVVFVVNALFNNMNRAHYSTICNFAKATIFTMPFVSYGASISGPSGVLWGLFIGSFAIAALTLFAGIRFLANYEKV